MDTIYSLMERPELTVSTDTRQLPPMSRDCCSMLAEPAVRGQVTCPLATFGALVHITTAWSEGSDDDAREFSTDFREQFVDFSGREECLKRIQTSTKHADPLVRLSAAVALGELAKGSDKDSMSVLLDLKFDQDPRVVEAVVQSTSQIVAGKRRENGLLASFVGIQAPTKGSKRLLSATRRLQPLPPRPLVTREWMDKMKDLDGDGWHAYIYWSQCFQVCVVIRRNHTFLGFPSMPSDQLRYRALGIPPVPSNQIPYEGLGIPIPPMPSNQMPNTL